VIKKFTTSKAKNQINFPLFRIEPTPKTDFTANGGLFLIAELIQKMGYPGKTCSANYLGPQEEC